MFKSTPTQKKLNTTLKTTMVAKGWLNRARKNLGSNKNDSDGSNGKTAIAMLTLKDIKEDTDSQATDDQQEKGAKQEKDNEFKNTNSHNETAFQNKDKKSNERNETTDNIEKQNDRSSLFFSLL
jgi:hypothetical protein